MNLALVPAPALTDAQRAFLSDPEKRRMLTKDVTLAFIDTFRLHPTIAGGLIAQWAKELTW